MENGINIANGSLPSSWSFLGPQNIGTQNLGIVISLAVNPIQTNEIYTGTNASGLWKTVDGENNWFNITDQLNMTSFGVEWISMDPGNPRYRTTPVVWFQLIQLYLLCFKI
jgi:hypothetical protein